MILALLGMFLYFWIVPVLIYDYQNKKDMKETKKVIIDNQPVNVADTKTVLSISGPSPMWTKWLFRITAVITTVLAFYVAGTSLIAENWKVEVMLGLKALDMLTLGLSKALGLIEK